MSQLARAGSKQRVLVLGGGFGGAYAAQKLSRKLPPDWDLTIVDRNNFLLFYPLLVEAGVGSLEARHENEPGAPPVWHSGWPKLHTRPKRSP